MYIEFIGFALNYFQGYTNADNPFGDEHLLDTFVWSKKMEKEGIEHHDTDEIHNLQKKKMEENRVRVYLYKYNNYSVIRQGLFLSKPTQKS